jgi:hypothetical protein
VAVDSCGHDGENTGDRPSENQIIKAWGPGDRTQHAEVLEPVSDSDDGGNDPEPVCDAVAPLTLRKVTPDRGLAIGSLHLMSPRLMRGTPAFDSLAFTAQTGTLLAHARAIHSMS